MIKRKRVYMAMDGKDGTERKWERGEGWGKKGMQGEMAKI